jgi:hypothetical protein
VRPWESATAVSLSIVRCLSGWTIGGLRVATADSHCPRESLGRLISALSDELEFERKLYSDEPVVVVGYNCFVLLASLCLFVACSHPCLSIALCLSPVFCGSSLSLFS